MDRPRWILLSLTLVPCLASLIAWTSPAAPAAVAPGNPKASLSFSQYAVNWKETRAVPSVYARFRFRNVTDQTVKVLSAKPSCGCVSATVIGFRPDAGPASNEPFKRTFGPGESGLIQLTLPTANEEAGRHEYTIAVTYNDGEDHTTDLKFNVELPAKSVRLEPSELHFYQYGEKLTKTFRVVDARNKILDVTDVHVEYYNSKAHVPAEIAEVTILPSETTPQGLRVTPIRVDVAGDVDPAEKIAHVVIATSDPDFPRLMCPMLIQPRKKAAALPQTSVPPLQE